MGKWLFRLAIITSPLVLVVDRAVYFMIFH
jgi:hypothetical protein